MQLAAHDVKEILVETKEFDSFVTRDLTILGKDGEELIVITLFGKTKEDLKLSIKDSCSIM